MWLSSPTLTFSAHRIRKLFIISNEATECARSSAIMARGEICLCLECWWVGGGGGGGFRSS
jgi:hypothetical protein